MARSRRKSIDDDNSWVLRADYLANTGDISEGIIDHADADYVFFSNDGTGDESGGLSVGMFTTPTTAQGNFTVWGKGIISLGAPTQAQIDFMIAADAGTDLLQFPGAFISVGYRDPATTDLYIAIKDSVVTGYPNAYTRIDFNNTSVLIYADRIEISNGSGTIDLGTGVQGTFTGATGPYRLAPLIEANGTAGDDVIGPTNAALTIFGLGGNDTITAGPASSDLHGDAGNDNLIGGNGADNLFGGADNDTVRGRQGDVLDGGSGNDTLIAERGATIRGGDGIDRMLLDFTGYGLWFDIALADGASGTIASIGTSYTGIERFDLTGGLGNDTLRGNSGVNVILGGAGADVISGGAGSDTLDAGVGGAAPEPTVTTSGQAFATAVSLDAAFTPIAGADPRAAIEIIETTSNTFDGYYAITVGAGGHLVVDGSGANNPLSNDYGINLYDAAFNKVATNVSGFALDVTDLAAGQYYIEVFTIVTPFSNQLSQVSVSLSTATTQDRHNVLSGGTGNDTFLVHQADDVVIERANEGTDTVIADLSWVLSPNVENITLKAGAGKIDATGNSLANVLTGNESPNVLNGGDGADTLIGGGGVDLMIGSTGADRMEGGTGNDAYRVENSGDLVVERADEGIDKVFSTITWSLTANTENLVLTGTAAINGTGNGLANQLTGNSAANVLDGGAGIDTMLGGAGNDTYRVDNRSDRIYETVTASSALDAGGTDKVISTATYTLDASGRQFVENLVLSGSAAINGTGNGLANRIDGNNGVNILTGLGGGDTLVGYNGNDRLYGGAGNDVLIAGAGDDRIDPGSGRDTLTGAGGADVFIFSNEAVLDAQTMANADRISDFSSAERDRIDLRLVDANLLASGDQAFTFIGTGAFTGQAGELRLERTSSATFLVGDITGDGIGDGYIRLAAGLTLVVGDFLL